MTYVLSGSPFLLFWQLVFGHRTTQWKELYVIYRPSKTLNNFQSVSKSSRTLRINQSKNYTSPVFLDGPSVFTISLEKGNYEFFNKISLKMSLKLDLHIQWRLLYIISVINLYVRGPLFVLSELKILFPGIYEYVRLIPYPLYSLFPTTLFGTKLSIFPNGYEQTFSSSSVIVSGFSSY